MSEIVLPGKVSDFMNIGMAAAWRGDVEAIGHILEQKPEWITRVGAHGRTMLWEASRRGKFEMVKYLAERGSDIDARGTHYTPYFVEVSCYCIARHRGHGGVARFLLKQGAAMDIHTAAFLGDIAAVEDALEHRPDSLNDGHPQHVMVDAKDGGPRYYTAPAAWATPLCYALRGAGIEASEYLIRNGARIRGNKAALFKAADDDHEKLRLLIENGADPQKLPPIYSDDGELSSLTPRTAAENRKAASERLVYLCRGDRGGNPVQLEQLVKLGADVDFRDRKGKTALHRASKSGFVKSMRVLLDHGAAVDAEDPYGETPLFDAVRSTIKRADRKMEAVRILLDAGADPLHTNRKGETPQRVAERRGVSDLIDALGREP